MVLMLYMISALLHLGLPGSDVSPYIWHSLLYFYMCFSDLIYGNNLFLQFPFLYSEILMKEGLDSPDFSLLHGTIRIRNKFPESFMILNINSEIKYHFLSNLGE